ncbi:MAG: phosphoglycerate dehydrogenase [Gammaproteobacteria bacterium]|nr:phosphoglycerate dehydrogenase [Gammaproteobacteria bacterium]
MGKNILIADKIAQSGIDYLTEQRGFEVDHITGLDEAGLCEIISKYHAVLVRSAVTITSAVMDLADNLQVIGRAGIGVDNIDVARATERGIAVLNTPNANATTTAELTIAHILSLSRNLPQADRSVKSGAWERSSFMGAELANKRLGIFGYGNIGRIVASRAKGLGMQVLAYDPFVNEEVFTADGVSGMELDELISVVDYFTFHCPVNDKTRGIMNAERIASMKKGSRIVNCARGGLIDEHALYEALSSGHLAGAALDVFETEPPVNSPLLGLDNIVLTPHLGASTKEAQTTAGSEIAQQVAVYLQTGEPINAINLPPVSAAELIRIGPYMTLAQRLGNLLGPMISGPVKNLEIALCGDAAERDVNTVCTEGLVGFLSAHMSAPVNRVNAGHIAKQQGILVSETTCMEHPDYHATIRISATHGDQITTIEGTLFDHRHPRLVRINDYEIEAALSGHLLITRHKDQPGVIAAISSIMAEHQINISRMQLGIVTGSDKAVAVIEVSQSLENEQMMKLEAIEAINQVMQVTL